LGILAKKTKPQKSKGAKYQHLKYYVLLAVVAFGVHANSLKNDFVFDDESVVLGDPTIKTLSSIPKYITAQEGFHKVIGRYYRPLVSASYAIDYSLWEFNPFGYHLTNIIIHVINTLLLFKLLLLIFCPGESKISETKIYVILFCSIIFAVHTIHTEAVAWISGRTDSLCFTFFAAAFIYYIKYSAERKTSYLIWVCLYYTFSLLAKEMTITFPVLVIMYDLIVKREFNKGGFRKKFAVYLVLILISVVYIFLRWLILKNVPERDTYFYFYGKDTFVTALTMLPALLLYFKLTFIPVNLVYHYSGYLPYESSIASVSVIAAVMFIVVMAVLAFYFVRKIPFVTFCITFFFVSLLPVINIVPTMNFMAERFLYITSVIVPLLGITLFIKYGNERNKKLFYAVFGLIILLYSYLTVLRNEDWKDNDTLFLSAEGKPGTITYVNIGNIYANKQQYDKAEGYYRKAIDLRDETLLANNNLGKIFLVRGNFDSAYYYMAKSHKLDTLSPEPLFAMAQLYANFDRFPEAIGQLEKIQKVTPNYMNSAQMLEQLKEKLNERDQVSISPDANLRIAQLERESYNNYVNKNYKLAIEQLEELAEINPEGKAGYYNNIGMSYLDQDNLKEAKKYFELSLEAKGDFSTGLNNLGMVYEKMGNKTKAKEYFQRALDIDPNNLNAKNNLKRVN